MKKRSAAILLSFVLTLGLAACSTNTPTSAAPTAIPSPTLTSSPVTPVPTQTVQAVGFLKGVGDYLGAGCTVSGTTIKLNQNVKLQDNAALLLDTADNFTLDFNGHTITAQVTKAGGSVILCTNGSLTLTDSVGGGGITMTSSTEAYAVVCGYEGIMYLNGIKVTAVLTGTSYQGIDKNRTGAYALYAKEGGRLTVNSGSYSGNVGLIVEYVRRKPTLTLNGGTFSGFVDLSGGADLIAFLGSGKKAVKNPDGSLMVTNS